MKYITSVTFTALFVCVGVFVIAYGCAVLACTSDACGTKAFYLHSTAVSAGFAGCAFIVTWSVVAIFIRLCCGRRYVEDPSVGGEN